MIGTLLVAAGVVVLLWTIALREEDVIAAIARIGHGKAPQAPVFGTPLVRLEWVGEIPIAYVEEGDPREVVSWMEAAKGGPVLHV